MRLHRNDFWAEDAILRRLTPPFGPRNTISSFAYAVAGSWLAWRTQTEAAAALAVAMWLLATGSALYHAFGKVPVWAQRLDWLGMYAVMGSVASYGWAPRSPVIPWVMLVAGALLGWIYATKLKWLGWELHMALLMIVGSIPVFVLGGDRRLLLAAYITFFLAYGFWHLDKAKSRWVGAWGHTAWHLLTAISIVLNHLSQGRP